MGLDFRIPILQSAIRAFHCSPSRCDVQVKALKVSHFRSSSHAGLSWQPPQPCVLYPDSSQPAEKLNTGNPDACKMDLGTNCQEQCYSVEEKLQKQHPCL